MNARTLCPAALPRSNRRAFLRTATTLSAAALAPCQSLAAEETEEILFSSAMSLSKAIRSGKVSSEEIVKAYLERIESINSKINSVVTLAADRAIEQAREADAQLARGDLRGVLHGVPMTIKDSLDTEGVVTTAGTFGRREFVPSDDATVVSRLRAAGAILLGKTNTPEFTMSYDTRNLVFGYTQNPYDVTKSPGGSSGGAAATIACGGTPFDIGSDTGGSIRVPSAFCGTAGIKPTSGRVPLTGHIISTGLGASDSLTQLGPMARFVDDLFPLLKIIAGVDGQDPATVPVPLRYPSAVKVSGLRVAHHSDNGILPASPEVKRTVNDAVDAVSQAGSSVLESRPQALPKLMDFLYMESAIDGHDWIRQLLEKSGTRRWDPHIDWFWELPPTTSSEAGRILRDWQRFRLEMLNWFRDFDALICPVYAHASLPSGFEMAGETLTGFTYTAAFNYTGWPSAVVRCGTSGDGMPIGVQVVSHPWREDICLAVAKHLETALGGWKQPTF